MQVAKTCLFIDNQKGIKHKNNERIPPKNCFSSLCLSLRSFFAFSGPDLELAMHFGSIHGQVGGLKGFGVFF